MAEVVAVLRIDFPLEEALRGTPLTVGSATLLAAIRRQAGQAMWNEPVSKLLHGSTSAPASSFLSFLSDGP